MQPRRNVTQPSRNATATTMRRTATRRNAAATQPKSVDSRTVTQRSRKAAGSRPEHDRNRDRTRTQYNATQANLLSRAVLYHSKLPQILDHGSEHVEYVLKENVAFISSGVQALFEDTGPRGSIFLYDFSEKNVEHKAIRLPIVNEPTDFIPHGMGHYYQNGKLYLIVISHTSYARGFEHRMEILEFNKERQSLLYVKTIRDKSFIKPNGLHAVGPEQFFFTNDGYAQKHFLSFLEMLLKLKSGSVYYYDGKQSHALVSADQTPNGIWADVKNKILYYASPLGEYIKVLKLDEDLKSVKGELAHVPLLTSPDNLFLDNEGALWTGAHPVLYKIGDVKACFQWKNQPKPSEYPPSQVLRIKFSEDFKTHELSEPYTDDGRQIPCSSHVVVDGKGNMLIGSVGLNAVHCEYTPKTIRGH